MGFKKRDAQNRSPAWFVSILSSIFSDWLNWFTKYEHIVVYNRRVVTYTNGDVAHKIAQWSNWSVNAIKLYVFSRTLFS